jgi:hypothetical protein
VVQLGQPAAAIVDISAGGCHTCAVFSGGGLKCWCAHAGGRAAPVLSGAPPAPPRRLVARLSHARMRCRLSVSPHPTPARARRGCNEWGQLGLGSSQVRYAAEPTSTGRLLPWVALGRTARAAAVSAQGEHHTCVTLHDGGAKCFGANARGQLGYGDKLPRGSLAHSMGDSLPLISPLGGAVKVRAAARPIRPPCARVSRLSVSHTLGWPSLRALPCPALPRVPI